MKKNSIIKLIVATVFFLLIFFLGMYYKSSFLNDDNHFKKAIQETQQKILEKENEIYIKLDEIILEYEKKDQAALFNNQQLIGFSEEEKISFFIYEKDSLLFWSDNSLGFPLKLTHFLNKPFVKLNNGYYQILKKEKKHTSFLAAILIKYEYAYENDFLLNDFNSFLDLSGKEMSIDSREDPDNLITNTDGEPLFSLKSTGLRKFPVLLDAFYIILYLTIFALLWALVLHVGKRIKFFSIKFFFYPGCFILILLLRYFSIEYQIPSVFFKAEIFSPLYYASSDIFPSLGDLLINVMIVFILLFLVFRRRDNIKPIRIKGRLLTNLAYLLYFFIIGFAFFRMIIFLDAVVIDSTISYNLSQLFTINAYSILGLFVFSIIFLSFILFHSLLFRLIENSQIKSIHFSMMLIVFALCLFLLKSLYSFNIIYLVILFSYLIVFQFYRNKNKNQYVFYEILLNLILISFISHFIIYDATQKKESDKIKSMAGKLSRGEDPVAEFLFKDIESKIVKDVQLFEELKNYPQSEYFIKQRIIDKYFTGFWDKYKVQVTICGENDSLQLQNQNKREHCNLYFENLAQNLGKKTGTDNLFLIDYGTGGSSYLYLFDTIANDQNVGFFIELNSKFIPKGLGYPELLIDKKLFINHEIADYSFAKYYNNSLVDAFGKYYYKIKFFIPEEMKNNESYRYEMNGHLHYVNTIGPLNYIIISKKKAGILEILTLFSTLFTFNLFVLFLFIIIAKTPRRNFYFLLNFKERLQLSMVSIILVSFSLIGISTYVFIKSLNDEKNNEILNEKAMSVLIELQEKFGNKEGITPDKLNFLSGFLSKLANVFFTDINLFDKNGNLISSSRPEIYSVGLVAEKINPKAYYNLVIDEKTFFIQKEKIGQLTYYSAYLPMNGSEGNLVCYINLPYFARESELKKEISTFLNSFINIYVFFILISILITLFVAGRITKPLNLIREKIGKIKLGIKNEKINWPGRDEIGALISEYNRMIDEIAESANLLAKSERESAWREMAMQVAHEIKNPLTPMKLSVQYLDRAWKNNADDFGQILLKFTKNMSEQIDSLSAIASEFSYFAKMPAPKNEKIDIVQVIENTISIFNTNNISIEFVYNKNKQYWIIADRKQIIRVMNNLINNAIQAINDKDDGLIRIAVASSDQQILIMVKDNGCGINPENQDKIFVPSFSTKTDGMGIGLAIVKGIVENCKGKIWFETEPNKGTTFYLSFPELENV